MYLSLIQRQLTFIKLATINLYLESIIQEFSNNPLNRKIPKLFINKIHQRVYNRLKNFRNIFINIYYEISNLILKLLIKRNKKK